MEGWLAKDSITRCEWRFILGMVGSQHSPGDRVEEGVNRFLIGRIQIR